MFFKRKDKNIEVTEEPKKTQTIQERMEEVYNWHVKQFMKEMEAGKIDIIIERKLSWYSFDNAVVGCAQDEKTEIVYSKKQLLGVLEVYKLAQKACDIVEEKIIKFAESKGYSCTDTGAGHYANFSFSAKERKDLSTLENEITEWQQ